MALLLGVAAMLPQRGLDCSTLGTCWQHFGDLLYVSRGWVTDTFFTVVY